MVTHQKIFYLGISKYDNIKLSKSAMGNLRPLELFNAALQKPLNYGFSKENQLNL
jgi:hypothetical protein